MQTRRVERDRFCFPGGIPLAVLLALGAAACSFTHDMTPGPFGNPAQAPAPNAAAAPAASKAVALSNTTSNAKTAQLGVGVNGYLWHASLDTLSFLPLASADPFGGTIITDWYSPTSSPNERFKVTVYILDRRLRADGLKVSVFRQQKAADGAWTDSALDAETPLKLENAILTRARQLRIATTDNR